jgi:F-type H+-transporting ATPase subunit gamma
MSETTASLQRKINTAEDLHSVVHAMKALAASSVGQYEKSVIALEDYYRIIKLGLRVCLQDTKLLHSNEKNKRSNKPGVATCIVFGSDQGLVGQFNEELSDYVLKILSSLPGEHNIWVIGERMHSQLTEKNISLNGLFPVPNSVKLIAPLIKRLLIECGVDQNKGINSSVYVFHNQPQTSSLYVPVFEKLLPLDENWQRDLIKIHWPSKKIPEPIGDNTLTLRGLIHEYLFIFLFRACAESLASENSSRLSAMERADHNIKELLKNLSGKFNQLRQSSIDEELFDVVSGFESLN